MRGRLTIRDNWTFFASSYGWDVIRRYWSKSALFKGGGSISPQISGGSQGTSFRCIVGIRKLECLGYLTMEILTSFIWVQYQHITAWQTNGFAVAITRLALYDVARKNFHNWPTHFKKYRLRQISTRHADNEICDWSHYNKVNINTKKTKKCCCAQSGKTHYHSITANNSSVEKVQSFKLLGVLRSWVKHCRSVHRSQQTAYFLKLLKRSGMTSDDLLYYYKTFIRPLTELCVCCLAFKYYGRTVRPTGGDTATSSSNHLWKRTAFWHSCHHTWHSTACRQCDRQMRQMLIAMHD